MSHKNKKQETTEIEVTPYPHEYCSLRFGVVVAYGQMCALVAPKNLTKTQVGLSQEGIGQSTVGQYADDKGTERYENEGSLSRPDKAGDQVAVEEKTTEAEPQEQNNGSTQTIGNIRKSRGIFQGQEYFKVRSISSEWDVSTESQQNRGAGEIYDVRDEGRKASQTRPRKYLVGKRKLLRKLQGHQPGKQKDLREAEVQIEKQEREEVETEKQVQEETQTEKQVKEDVQTEKQVQDDVQSEKQVQKDVQSEKQVQEDVQTEKQVQDDMQSEKQIQEKREEQAERPKESQDEEQTDIQEEESQRGVEEGGLSGRYPEPTTSAEEEDGQNVTDRLEPGSPLLCGDSLTALKDLTVFYSSNLTGLIRVDIYARLTQFIPWIVDNVHDLEPMVRLDSGYEDELFKAPGPYPIVRQTGIVVDKSAGMSEGPSAKLTTSAIALISLIYYVVRQ
ncbi:hypothetical protein AAG570_005604 [Ranatra chinensis]|uniref:Uncharacterized protein n=1 Tax=Ranatra chinensis TaxID=642074 RepID=A0ABD0XXX2_9HEMI